MTIVRQRSGTGSGTPGADGESAYQLAVNQGFSGTLSQWLASLVGPEGPPGQDGTGGGATLSIRHVTGNYTLVNADGGKLVSVDVTAPAAAVVTIPAGLTGSLTAPLQCLIGRRGTGTVTIAAAVGVTLIPDDRRLALATVGAKASLIHEGGDVWWIDGGLV